MTSSGDPTKAMAQTDSQLHVRKPSEDSNKSQMIVQDLIDESGKIDLKTQQIDKSVKLNLNNIHEKGRVSPVEFKEGFLEQMYDIRDKADQRPSVFSSGF